MIEFVKKHKICSILILLILSFLVYIKFFFVLKLPLGFGPPINYTKEEWKERQLHFRRYWEPFDITTLNTKRIHYHNYSGKFYHCFGLGLEEQVINEKLKDFKEKYRTEYHKKSDAEFDLGKKDKPHLHVRVYYDSVLFIEQDVYMMEAQEISYPFEIKGQDIKLKALNGYSKPRELACYHFEDNTDYEIEIINLVPFPEYKGIRSFLKIETGQRYQPNVQEEKAP